MQLKIISRSVIFFLLLCCVTTTLIAQLRGQDLIDSLDAALPGMKEDSNKVKTFSTISQIYYGINITKAFPYVEQGLQLAEKIKWKKGIANLNNNLGLFISDTGNYALGNEHFFKSLALNREMDSKRNQINNLNNIGRNYNYQSDFKTAATYFFQALTIAQDLKSDELIALVGTNLSACFYSQKNYPKTYEYADMTYKHAQLAQNVPHMINALMQFGSVSLAIKDTAKGVTYLEKALKLTEENDLYVDMAKVLVNLSITAYPDYKKAIAMMMRVDTIIRQVAPGSETDLVNKFNLADCNNQLAKQHMGAEKNNYIREAERWLIETKALLQEERPEMMVNILLLESDLAEGRGDYNAALTYYRRSTSLTDSLFSQEKKNDIAELEGKHKLTLKDKEIAINKLMLDNQRKFQWGLIAGLVCFVIIIALLFRQNSIRKENNRKLMLLNKQLDEANNVKSRFFSILSHDLRSPVIKLMHFLQLQKEQPSLFNENQQRDHQQKISNSAENLLNTMEAMLLWSKEQMKEFRPDMKPTSIDDLFRYLQDFFGDTGNVSIEYHAEPGIVVISDENYLRTIMQNLTSNAIAALKNKVGGQVKWMAKREADGLVFSITDNGPGIPPEKVQMLFEQSMLPNGRTGLGLHLVRDLAKAIGYRISVGSKVEVGTTVTLRA